MNNKPSWRTTAMGIVTLLTVLLSVVQAALNGDMSTVNWPTVIAAITTSLGLIAARDHANP